MIKLIFYGWEVGMRSIPFIKLLCLYAGLSLKDAHQKSLEIRENVPFEVIIEDEKVANEVYEKALKYKVLVRKEYL